MNDVRQCRTVVLIIVQDFYILQKNGFSIDKGLQCHCKREQ